MSKPMVEPASEPTDEPAAELTDEPLSFNLTLSPSVSLTFIGEDPFLCAVGVEGGTAPYAVDHAISRTGVEVYQSRDLTSFVSFFPAEKGSYVLTVRVTDALGAEAVAECAFKAARRDDSPILSPLYAYAPQQSAPKRWIRLGRYR